MHRKRSQKTDRMQNFIGNWFQQENVWIHLETWTASPPAAGRVEKEGRPRVSPSLPQKTWDPRERSRFLPFSWGSCNYLTQGSPGQPAAEERRLSS